MRTWNIPRPIPVQEFRAEEGGGLIMHSWIIYEYTVIQMYKHPLPVQELRAEEGGGLIIRSLRYHILANELIATYLNTPCMYAPNKIPGHFAKFHPIRPGTSPGIFPRTVGTTGFPSFPTVGLVSQSQTKRHLEGTVNYP